MQLWRLWLVLAHTFIISLTASSALQPQRWGASRVVWQTSSLESETYRIWAVSAPTGPRWIILDWFWTNADSLNNVRAGEQSDQLWLSLSDRIYKIGFCLYMAHSLTLLTNFSNVYILEWNGPKCVLPNIFFWSRYSLNSLACSWDTKRNMLTNSSFHRRCLILQTPPFTP